MFMYLKTLKLQTSMAVQNYIKPKSKYPLTNTFASYSGITISS